MQLSAFLEEVHKSLAFISLDKPVYTVLYMFLQDKSIVSANLELGK